MRKTRFEREVEIAWYGFIMLLFVFTCGRQDALRV